VISTDIPTVVLIHPASGIAPLRSQRCASCVPLSLPPSSRKHPEHSSEYQSHPWIDLLPARPPIPVDYLPSGEGEGLASQERREIHYDLLYQEICGQRSRLRNDRKSRRYQGNPHHAPAVFHGSQIDGIPLIGFADRILLQPEPSRPGSPTRELPILEPEMS